MGNSPWDGRLQCMITFPFFLFFFFFNQMWSLRTHTLSKSLYRLKHKYKTLRCNKPKSCTIHESQFSFIRRTLTHNHQSPDRLRNTLFSVKQGKKEKKKEKKKDKEVQHSYQYFSKQHEKVKTNQLTKLWLSVTCRWARI